jgi:CubicO group peptidase (beta-lactamase class C family)
VSRSVGEVAERRRNALGFCTKELCSALFVSGRRGSDVVDHDLRILCTRFAGGVLDPDEIAFAVGPGTVVGALPDGTRRRAVASGDKGAALVASGRSDLSGHPLRARELDARGWPQGDGFRPDARYTPLHDAVRAHLATSAGRGVAVVHRGELVAQDFAPGFGPGVPTRGWSTAKTLTALIVGRLAQQGLLDPEAAPVPIPAWRGDGDPRAEIRVLDLLGLQSGLSVDRPEDGSDDMLTDADEYFAPYFRPVSVAEMVAGAGSATPPGKTFSYKSIDHLAVSLALREILGPDVHGFLSGTVLPALGLRHSVLETDAEGVPLLCGAWYTTPGDLARMGALLLGRGQLAGEQVLPGAWITTMLTESDASSAGRTEGPSALCHPYGASLWLNRDGHIAAAPRRTFYALGSLGQAMFVLPEQDLVIARTGLDHTPDHNRLISAVLTALPLCEVPR